MNRILEKIIMKIRYCFGGFFRNRKIRMMREKLVNKDFSIISSNCCGAILAHDLGIRFNSPTVNCFFYPNDFLKFCRNLQYYLNQEPEYQYDAEEGYPICLIGDIYVFAMHYKSFDEFKESWNRRKKRVNYNNLFIMMTDRDGFEEDMLGKLASIPYPKILFSHKEYPSYDFVCYVKQFKRESQVGDMFKYADIFGNRYYEKVVDIVSWLNGGKNK